MTRASESSATHRSKTREQDWEIQENQDLMDVEDQETEDESNVSSLICLAEQVLIILSKDLP